MQPIDSGKRPLDTPGIDTAALKAQKTHAHTSPSVRAEAVVQPYDLGDVDGAAISLADGGCFYVRVVNGEGNSTLLNVRARGPELAHCMWTYSRP